MNKGKQAAIRLREEIGLEDPNDIPIEDVVIGRGGILQYKSMGKIDGRIVYGKKVCTIFINSDIQYEGRRRFAIAHELGHLEMHRGSLIHDDGASLEWFNNAETQLKKGIQEYEANQFATEYLMPSSIFHAEATGKIFGPDLIKQLAERFLTSLTSVVFKYFETDLHPIAIFHIFNGKVRYWKKSDDLRVWIKDITRLSPPEDSVAMEYINADYEPIYRANDLRQEISKSTYFNLKDYEDDTEFYEYCIVTKAYKNILSVVWEK
ncbi:MAG: ImmA/IrrE family metallo-endopeptidase [Saprospiraceae bacterium]|nr:ImmA/IrrE family metallo-endopeptidase [Lewinella sp.]